MFICVINSFKQLNVITHHNLPVIAFTTYLPRKKAVTGWCAAFHISNFDNHFTKQCHSNRATKTGVVQLLLVEIGLNYVKDLAHGYEFFGGGGVNGHGIVKIAFGRAHF